MKAGGSGYGRWFLFAACAAGLLRAAGSAGAQDLVDAAVADLDDYRTLFRNPASLSLLSDRLIFGTSAGDVGINPGAFDLRNGFVGYHGSFGRRRIGLNGRFLNTGIFRRTDIGLSWGEIVHRSIAVGARLDVRSQGFDRNRFQGVDPGDPALASGLTKNYVSVSAGVLAVPAPDWSAGIVVENINRPDVALTPGAGYRLPVVLDVGLQYRAERFHPSVDVRIEDGTASLRLRMGVVVREDHLLRVDLRRERIGFEGLIRLYRGVHLDYRYDYPLNELNTFSRGSHALSFVYDFAPRPDLPEPRPIRGPDPVPITRSTEPIPLAGDFLLLASTPGLDIREERITRRADPDIAPDFIRRNFSEIFAEPQPLLGADVDAAEPRIDESVPLEGIYSPAYRGSLDSLRAVLGDSAGLETVIYTDADDLPRAENLRDFIAARTGLPPDRIRIAGRDAPTAEKPAETGTDGAGADGGATGDASAVDLSLLGRTETRIVLSDEALEFRVVSPGADDHVGPWSLVVRDREDRPIRTIEGTGPVPERIDWDWHLDDGTLIRPGWYTYRLQWEGRRGEPRESPPGRFHVRKYRKDITIELTRKRKRPNPGVDRLELRLDR